MVLNENQIEIKLKTLKLEEFQRLPENMRTSQQIDGTREFLPKIGSFISRVETKAYFNQNRDGSHNRQQSIGFGRSATLLNIPQQRPQPLKNNLVKIGNQITEAKRIKTLASITNDVDKEDYGDLEKDQMTFSIGKGMRTSTNAPRASGSLSKLEKAKTFNQAPRSQSIAQYLHTQKDKIVEEEKEEFGESSAAASDAQL